MLKGDLIEKNLAEINSSIEEIRMKNEKKRGEIEKIKIDITIRDKKIEQLKQTINQINLTNHKDSMEMIQKINDIPEEQLTAVLEALHAVPLPDSRQKALDIAEELLQNIRRHRIDSRISIVTERLKTATGESRQSLQNELKELLAKQA